MPPTLVTGDRVTPLAASADGGDAAWVPLARLEGATGWELKPEGACRGGVCVPIPPGREAEFVRPGAFNFTALARHLGQPVVHDAEHEAWVVGESAKARASALQSLEAPDFTLPDLRGEMHSLSDFRGKKVFLASWASW